MENVTDSELTNKAKERGGDAGSKNEHKQTKLP